MANWITRVEKDYWVSSGSGRLKFTKDQADTWIKNFNQAAKAPDAQFVERPRNLNNSQVVKDIDEVTESSHGSLVLMGVDLSKYQ